MKILLFIFSIISTPLFSQSSTTFRPYWEFGMQYNYEGNSAFKSNNSEFLLLSGTTKNPSTTHTMRAGYSFRINGQFNISKHIAFLGYLGFAFRNYSSRVPFLFDNGLNVTQIDNLFFDQSTSYEVIEFAIGVTFRPKANGKLSFSTGLGISNTSNFEIINEFGTPLVNTFFLENSTFLPGTPLFSFLAVNYTILESSSAQIFIEPHFKMDLVKHNQSSSLQQANYTFGIGIGGSVKIGN